MPKAVKPGASALGNRKPFMELKMFNPGQKVYNEVLYSGRVISQEGRWVLVNFEHFGLVEVQDCSLVAF